MGRNRIELWGRLANQPLLRTTPGGGSLLRLAVDCTDGGEHLRFDVVVLGEAARLAARRLRAGQELYVAGQLRTVRRAPTPAGLKAPAIEVLASEIRPAEG